MFHSALVFHSTRSARSACSGRRVLAAAALSACLLAVACKQQAPPDTKRLNAIAALKAVNSVVENHGTLEQFRKYQLEAAIKVDALPDAPDLADIKAVATLYKHANELAGISSSTTVSSSELAELRKTYADMPEFIKTLNQINTGLADKEVKMAGSEGLDRDLLAIDIRTGRKLNHLFALEAMGFLTAKASPLVKALQ